MTKRRVRLGIGLDRQKLADTIQQVFDSVAELPGLSIDAHTEAGWLHLAPRGGLDDEGKLPQVNGWLLTFGYPHSEEPGQRLKGVMLPDREGVRLAAWEAGLFVSYWLPPEVPAGELASLVIELVREVQSVPEGAQVEVALEYGG